MLIKITRKCRMGCSHCLDDAKPVEEYMSFDVFKRVIEFISEHPYTQIIISGGEPTEHYDLRYYPIRINTDDDIFKLNNVVFIDKVEHIYPMGRALDNNIKHDSVGSKCFNIRSITRNTKDLNNTFYQLFLRMKFCTPNVDIHGDIKLGESLLCPECSNIFKSDDEIVQDIVNFKCSKCDLINKKLPKEYRNAIGED